MNYQYLVDLTIHYTSFGWAPRCTKLHRDALVVFFLEQKKVSSTLWSEEHDRLFPYDLWLDDVELDGFCSICRE